MPATPHGAAPAAKTTQATFTIKWTNPSAPASVRRKDAISPSAQSIAISINGNLSTVANRTGSGSQAIPLVAPVGQDQFLFNVYDGSNGGGHLLGTATVSQLIVDGAANAVTAVIQAVCSVTNVQFANDDPLVTHTVYGQSGLTALTLQSIVVAGQSPATLIVEPEDVDGNVIIAGTGGTVSAFITGSATITQVDGAHIRLTPVTGARATTPDTLTLAAPTCPSTTVAVQHSPAIYAENTSYDTSILDWYGNSNPSVALATGDVLIGYDIHSQKMIAYNSGSGAVNAYSLGLSSHALLYTISTGMRAAWSNNLDAVFGSKLSGSSPNYDCNWYTFVNPGGPENVSYGYNGASTVCLVAASTFSTIPAGYVTSNGTVYNIGFPSGNASSGSSNSLATWVSLAPDDRTSTLYAFNSATPYVFAYPEALAGSATSSGTFGFTSALGVGAVDTDGDNLYAMLSNGTLEASSSGGTALSGFVLGGYGTGLALVVLSTNEH